MPTRLPLGHAVLWVLFGGLGAQLAGGLTSGLLSAFLESRGASPEDLAGSALVVAPALVVSSALLIAISLVAPALSGVPVTRALGLRSAPPICYGAAALGTIMLGPTADWLMRILEELFPEASLGVVPMLNELVRSLPVAAAVPIFALLPGISEELLFRGLLQNAARTRVLAIAISAIGFSLFHIDPHHVVGVLPLGFFLAWVAARCGTYVTIVAHALNNGAAIVAVHSQTFDVGYGTEQPMPTVWLPISLLIVAAAAAVIVRATPQRGVSPAAPSMLS